MNRLNGVWMIRLLLSGVVLLVGSSIARLSIYRYRLLMSDWAFDLAFFHNLIFNASSGRGFTQSSSTHELDGLINLSHAFFALPILVPVYRLFPALETLLVVQALAVAAGAWGVRRLALASGASETLAGLLVLGYLSSFPVWRLGIADFRPIIISLGVQLWVAAALCEHRRLELALSLLVACLMREEVSVLVGALSIGLFMAGRARPREAFSVVVISAAYFLVQLWLRPRSAYYVPLDRPGVLLDSLVLTRVSRPEALASARHLLTYLPIGMLPALTSRVLIAAIPLGAYLLLLSPYEWWTWQGPYLHHAAPIFVFVSVAAATRWGELERRLLIRNPASTWARWLRGMLFLLIVSQSILTWDALQGPLGLRDDPPTTEGRLLKAAAIAQWIDVVPRDASVACDYASIARFSGRERVYCYQSAFEASRPPDGSSRDKSVGLWSVDAVVVDEGDQPWLERLVAESAFEEMDAKGGYRLFQRRGKGNFAEPFPESEVRGTSSNQGSEGHRMVTP